jgi:hypothetical protein
VSLRRLTSIKARAWYMAAQWVLDRADPGYLCDTPDQRAVRAHLLCSVVPALRRRADIIERNRRGPR